LCGRSQGCAGGVTTITYVPLTQLDPTSALILIDLQKGIVDSVRPAVDSVLRNAGALADAFRAHGRTVVLVNVAGGASGRTDAQAAGGSQPPRPEGFADLVPELGSDPQDILLTKHRWGAFTGSDLDKQLRSLGVTQVVMGGVSTSIGVETTARSAYELGYHVVLATDAMLDREPVAHEHSIARIFPRLGETSTTAAILAALEDAPR
jgi:nicotinamidase-related amidase